ncbi:MAG: glycosyltransferase family 39 protein [Thermoguttaceae bacterium]
MNHRRLAAVVALGLLAYLAAFFAVSLPSLAVDGPAPSRFGLLWQLVWLPDQWLTPNWFGCPSEFSLVDRLPVLAVASAVVLWAALLGWLAVGLVRADRFLDRLELWVFSTAVGLSLLSTWTLLLGLLGVLSRTWLFTVPAAATVFLAMLKKFVRPKNKKSDRVTAFQPTNPRTDSLESVGLSLQFAWLAVPFVAMIVLAAMLPPLDFDVREYHLQAPKEFFLHGAIHFLPHNVYANMALGTEMLSLLSMVVAGQWWLGALAGKTVIAVFTVLAAAGLFLAGRRLHSSTAGIVAMLAYVSVPWVVSIASGGLVEGASACYLFLAVYALLLPKDGGALGLAGYLAGAAVATKYPAALFVVAPLGVWVACDRRSIRAVAVFLLAAALGCGLWFGKNWVQTGNPTYPLLYEVFDGRTWTDAKQRQWNQVHRPHDFSAATLAKDVGRVTLTSEWLSPLVVPLAALAFLAAGRRDRRRWAVLGYFVFVVAVWWLFTHRIDRFWIPAMPLLALLAGLGACWTSQRWWRVTLIVLLLVGLTANFLIASAGRGNAWFVPLDRLRHESGWIDPWHEYLNAHLGPSDGALLLVGDATPFDLTMPVFYNTCFDDCLFERWVRDKTSDEVRAELSSRRIGHVFVDWDEIARYRSPGNYGFTEFVRPKVLDRLVAEGVLEPLPSISGRSARAYRVVSESRR